MGCVIVTGATGGIGRALVDAFVEAKYTVIATDIADKAPGSAAHHYVGCNLATTADNPEYADSVFATIREIIRDEPLDALINNAALQVLGGVETLDRESWKRTLNVNLIAPFLWTQALLPELKAAKGCVVNISSVHARLTKPNFVAYATSKAALSALTRAMAVDLGAGVRINAIEPAAIATDMLKDGFAKSPGALDELCRHHPVGRIGTPSEVADLAVMLVSNKLGFLHGACVGFDGGISAVLSDPGS